MSDDNKKKISPVKKKSYFSLRLPRWLALKDHETDSSQLSWSFKDTFSVGLHTARLLSHFAAILGLLFVMLGVGISLGYLVSQLDDVTLPEEKTLVKEVQSASLISKLSYADGSLISEVDTDLLRTPVSTEAISDNIKKAIIATEDEHFFEHEGVVPKAIFRALLTSVLGFGESSGGSTLTQQLLKQQVLGADPTFKRKAREIVYALSLEKILDKESILTAYLNISPFGRNNKGQNIAGIEEAAQGIFGVSANDLTIPQAAFLAGLPQSPIVYSPYAADGRLKSDDDLSYGINRARNVLYNLYREGYLSQVDYETYQAYDIKQDFIPTETIEITSHDYLYYTAMAEARRIMYDYLIKEDQLTEQDLKNDATRLAYEKRAAETLQTGGYDIKTTIQPAIHHAMQAFVASNGHLLDDGTGRIEVGNVLMDNQTGAVLGFIGGRDYSSNQNNHAFDTVRSPGSAIKPLLAYGPAIDQGLMGSASMLSNYPTTFSSGDKILHNGNEGTGMVNLQEALNMSWNIPAFWTYQLLRDKGIAVEDYMTKLGIKIPNYQIESLPLGGGVEVSVNQLTNAYQAIANRGHYQESHVVATITDSEGNLIYEHSSKATPVYSEATASILQHLLRGPLESGKTTQFLTYLNTKNSDLANKVDWIGKTGTTNDFSDVWLALATPSVSLSSWAGHDNNASLTELHGYKNHANYVAGLVAAIHQANPAVFGMDQKFTLDPTVIKAEVNQQTGLKSGVATENGRRYSLSGNTTTSYWAKSGPGDLTYQFAIGGRPSDYQDAWNRIIGGH